MENKISDQRILSFCKSLPKGNIFKDEDSLNSMRGFLVFGIVIMLFIFGCTGSKSTSEEQIEVLDEQDPVITEPGEDMVKICFPLKFANGEYIFTTANATQALGGTWKVDSDLFIDPEIAGHCAYILEDQNANYPQLIIQTTVPSDTFEPEGKKSIPELGTAYVEDGFLTIKKGQDVITIACARSSSTNCSDDEFLRIGKIILSRWP